MREWPVKERWLEVGADGVVVRARSVAHSDALVSVVERR
jgi:hypothetical protein